MPINLLGLSYHQKLDVDLLTLVLLNKLMGWLVCVYQFLNSLDTSTPPSDKTAICIFIPGKFLFQGVKISL